MADHRHTGWAVLDAVRDAGNRWVFTEDGEPWAGVRMVCMGASPQPTHFVDVTTTIDRGVASLREHRAYLEHVGGDAELVREWAANAGKDLGVAYATTFEVVAS
jgi:LmbE family N-acetylglucosaminyl deacetylase